MSKKRSVGVGTEYQKAVEIIMHEPDFELFCGLLHPQAALFEQPFDRVAAGLEHKTYVAALKNRGISVLLLSDILLGNTNVGALGVSQQDDLLEMAYQSVTVVQNLIPANDHYTKPRIEEVFAKLNRRDLIYVILLRPKLVLKPGPQLDLPVSIDRYEFDPMPNLYFMRDQLITTDKGVVLGRMALNIRAPELDVVRFALNKLGINPLYQIQDPGTLEGGDFIPCGDFAFIGQGARTNSNAIQQLLSNDVFGYKEIVVVKDAKKLQVQMHLDTYFNIVGEKHCLLAEERFYDDFKPRIDRYRKNTQGYVLESRDEDFVEFLTKKHFRIIRISTAEQRYYGVNVLCTADREFIGSTMETNDETIRYTARFDLEGIATELLKFDNIKRGYGSNHCMTQVISRI